MTITDEMIEAAAMAIREVFGARAGIGHVFGKAKEWKHLPDRLKPTTQRGGSGVTCGAARVTAFEESWLSVHTCAPHGSLYFAREQGESCVPRTSVQSPYRHSEKQNPTRSRHVRDLERARSAGDDCRRDEAFHALASAEVVRVDAAIDARRKARLKMPNRREADAAVEAKAMAQTRDTLREAEVRRKYRRNSSLAPPSSGSTSRHRQQL